MDLNYASAYQQNQQLPPKHSLARFGNGGSNGGAATLLMQQREQLHQGQLGGAYSSPTTTSSHTQFALTPSSTTITPPRNFGPYTPSTNTSRSPSLSSGLPQLQHPYSSNTPSSMAAQTMTPNPQLGGLQSPSKPTSIQLPTVEATSRDQERVTLLLEINQLLLQEIVTLQEAGKGGDVQSPAKTGEGGKPEEGKSVASQEYVDCMRRMQSNLAYLANVAERASRPTQAQMPWPPLMGVPTTGPSQLSEMYVKLQNMFPAWKTHQAQQKAGGGGGGGSVGHLSPGSGVGTPGGM